MVDTINYVTDMLSVANYTLIENCLELFKIMFTKLCRYRHKSFSQYYELVQKACGRIDQTMLAQLAYAKLRISFFSVISIIWISEGEIKFIYKVFEDIRGTLSHTCDLAHLATYMTDVTGLLEPVESEEVFKILMELVLSDMQLYLPRHLGTIDKVHEAFTNELFLKNFMCFLLTIMNDEHQRLTSCVHTELPIRTEEMFRPYLLEVLHHDYPRKTVEVWLKFMKLNPLARLLPLDRGFRERNALEFKNLLRYYFENLHRLETIEEFITVYAYIEDNINFMVNWWDEIMVRGYKPDINVAMVVDSKIWSSSKQKDLFGALLFRIGRYD
jgi:hypothetical protein